MRAALILLVLLAACRPQSNAPADEGRTYRQDVEQCARDPEAIFCREAP